MKQVTLNIPDKDYDFFIAMLKKFGFIKIKEGDFVIPEEHKKLVRERRKTSTRNDFIKWTEARKSFKS